MKQRIIIDTDMGVDDILAIALALNSPSIEIEAISVTSGVAELNQGANNLIRLLSYFDRLDIPVYKGFDATYSKVSFPNIDRKRANKLTLLKSLSIPKKRPTAINLKRLNFLKVNPNTKLLCLAPLTNIANIANNNPLLIMGGAVFKPGNVPPTYKLEFNIAIDPQAAQVIFNKNGPIILIATDATSQVPAKNKSFIVKVEKTPAITPLGKVIKAIILENQTDFLDFYDPLAAAILIDKKIISKSMPIDLDISPSGQTLGEIVTKSNISLVTEINQNIFYQTLINAIS